MKLKDSLWIIIIVLITLVIVIPQSRQTFEILTQTYPYIMGFVKTALLATLGERLIYRIKTGYYFKDSGIILKTIVWGFLGMVFVLIFKVFAEGVISSQASGLLPVINNDTFSAKLLTAFLISFWMNLFFAPSFMLLHRITDGFIEQAKGNIFDIHHVKLKSVISTIDFQYFFSFVIFKTIPFFWIPAHTITFLLPENYRVLMAAYLSIALGLILTFAKQRHIKKS
jgi:hypothetical protein